MDQVFLKVPFALSGDQSVIPQPIDLSGAVSFTQGYGPDYQRDQTVDPLAKDIPRGAMNYLFYAITVGLQQYQTFGTPEFITTADNGGVAYSYSKGARVRYRVTPADPWNVYESKVDTNTALPTVTANWQLATYLTLADAATTYALKNNTVLTGTATTGAISASANISTSAVLLGASAVIPAIFSNNLGAASGTTIGVGADLILGLHYPQTDNFYTNGKAGARWSVVYAATGTINTSDARDKSDVRKLDENEINAAVAISREIGAYKLLASMASKGNAARSHIGMTVQRAIEIMRSFNLDPFGYGFICYDQWNDEVVREASPAVMVDVRDDAGDVADVVQATPAFERLEIKAGDKYGFRMDEFLAFIAVGFEHRLTLLEARA